jgi:hypothetical protein
MASWSGDEYGCGPEFWEEQDPEFKGEFPILQKRDFRSMCEVRSYAPNKLVLWPTCSHSEHCVMQVYEGWGNYGRRFWHCPLARVSYGNDICSSTMLGLLTFFGNFPVLRRWWQLWLLAMGGSPRHWPYKNYINYLHGIVIYNLQRRQDEALASPDRPANNQCCPCATCTGECYAKMRDWYPLPSPPPPPPLGYYMSSQQSSGAGSLLYGQFSYN